MKTFLTFSLCLLVSGCGKMGPLMTTQEYNVKHGIKTDNLDKVKYQDPDYPLEYDNEDKVYLGDSK